MSKKNRQNGNKLQVFLGLIVLIGAVLGLIAFILHFTDKKNCNENFKKSKPKITKTDFENIHKRKTLSLLNKQLTQTKNPKHHKAIQLTIKNIENFKYEDATSDWDHYWNFFSSHFDDALAVLATPLYPLFMAGGGLYNALGKDEMIQTKQDPALIPGTIGLFLLVAVFTEGGHIMKSIIAAFGGGPKTPIPPASAEEMAAESGVDQGVTDGIVAFVEDGETDEIIAVMTPESPAVVVM